MSTASLAATALASAVALLGLGSAVYEHRVVDPAGPRRPDLIQPDCGGISPAPVLGTTLAFALALVVALASAWAQPQVRARLLVGLASHVLMRIWSAFDLIPKALAFERADPGTIVQEIAHRCTRRSLWRLPLDVVTGAPMLAAFAAAARLA